MKNSIRESISSRYHREASRQINILTRQILSSNSKKGEDLNRFEIRYPGFEVYLGFGA